MNQTGRICNGSDSDNWRDRRGSTPASLPIHSSFSSSASSSSSSSSSSPSSPPSNFSSSTSSFPALVSSVNRNRNDGFLSSSSCSYFEGVSSSRRASTCSQRSPSPQITDDLAELLSQLGLMKYIDVFEQQEVNSQKDCD